MPYSSALLPSRYLDLEALPRSSNSFSANMSELLSPVFFCSPRIRRPSESYSYIYFIPATVSVTLCFPKEPVRMNRLIGRFCDYNTFNNSSSLTSESLHTYKSTFPSPTIPATRSRSYFRLKSAASFSELNKPFLFSICI